MVHEYLPNANGDLKVNDWLAPSYLYGVGGLGITLDEFIKWNDALDKNGLISDNTKSLMFSEFEYNNDVKLFSSGWEIHPINNSISYGFSGRHLTYFIKYPDSNTTIIWLSSGYKYQYNMKTVVDYIAGIAESNLTNNNSKIREDVCSLFYKGDIKLAISNYKKIKKENPTFVYHLVLNAIGYSLIERKQYKDAIEVIQLNVKENPESANYFDSLGEGYFYAEEYELSKQNYLKTLELDHGSSNAKKMIEQIENLLKK